MNKADKENSKDSKVNNAKGNNSTMKEMMNLLSENNANLNNVMGNAEMDKEQMIESFLLFQKFMSLNMNANKTNLNNVIVEEVKGDKAEDENKQLKGNKMIKSEINKIELDKNKENDHEGMIEIEKTDKVNEIKEPKEQYDTIRQSNRDESNDHNDNDNDNDNAFNQFDHNQEAVNNNVEDQTIEDNKEYQMKDRDKDCDNNNEQIAIDPSLSNFLSEPKKPNMPIATTIKNQYDEIPIKPSTSNFIELLEQNLQNDEQFQAPSVPKKKIIKKPPTQKKQIVISKPTKEEIKKYTYYSDNFDDEEKAFEEKEKEKKKKIKNQKVQLEQQIQQKQNHLVEKQGPQMQIQNKKDNQLSQEKKIIKPK